MNSPFGMDIPASMLTSLNINEESCIRKFHMLKKKKKKNEMVQELLGLLTRLRNSHSLTQNLIFQTTFQKLMKTDCAFL